MKELDKTKIYDLRCLSYKRLKNLIYEIKGYNFRFADLECNTLEYYNGKWNLIYCKEKLPHHVNALTLFEPEVNIINKQSTDKVLPKMSEEKGQKHYDNSKGSLYQFCEDQKLNSYEFDIIKRVMRCRKKGHFVEDLEKTKFLIDLYLKEFNHEK